MIVIIPEGIEAVVSSSLGSNGHSHDTRGLGRLLATRGRVEARIPVGDVYQSHDDANPDLATYIRSLVSDESDIYARDAEEHSHSHAAAESDKGHHEEEEHTDIPTFYIGLSMVLGFVLMFLIDRIPRHATENMRSEPQMRHVNLNNLGAGASSVEEEETFLGGMTSSPKQGRSFATTIGLVIHACADGIAMGAGAGSSDTQLGLIIFIAIMLHKAPAAFGLSSVLLKQGLSKRAARAHLLVFSLAAPFGALATWSIIALLGGGQFEGASGKFWTGLLLLFSAGTFL